MCHVRRGISRPQFAAPLLWLLHRRTSLLLHVDKKVSQPVVKTYAPPSQAYSGDGVSSTPWGQGKCVQQENGILEGGFRVFKNQHYQKGDIFGQEKHMSQGKV